MREIAMMARHEPLAAPRRAPLASKESASSLESVGVALDRNIKLAPEALATDLEALKSWFHYTTIESAGIRKINGKDFAVIAATTTGPDGVTSFAMTAQTSLRRRAVQRVVHVRPECRRLRRTRVADRGIHQVPHVDRMKRHGHRQSDVSDYLNAF